MKRVLFFQLTWARAAPRPPRGLVTSVMLVESEAALLGRRRKGESIRRSGVSSVKRNLRLILLSHGCAAMFLSEKQINFSYYLKSHSCPCWEFLQVTDAASALFDSTAQLFQNTVAPSRGHLQNSPPTPPSSGAITSRNKVAAGKPPNMCKHDPRQRLGERPMEVWHLMRRDDQIGCDHFFVFAYWCCYFLFISCPVLFSVVFSLVPKWNSIQCPNAKLMVHLLYLIGGSRKSLLLSKK